MHIIITLYNNSLKETSVSHFTGALFLNLKLSGASRLALLLYWHVIKRKHQKRCLSVATLT